MQKTFNFLGAICIHMTIISITVVMKSHSRKSELDTVILIFQNMKRVNYIFFGFFLKRAAARVILFSAVQRNLLKCKVQNLHKL